MGERFLPNWITGYLAYTAESRSPESFHTWVAMSTIAGAMRRKSFFGFEYFMLFPNLYVVLVAPAGKCKKSTALRIGRKILGQVPGVNFTTDSITRERLILDLTQAYSDGSSAMTAYSSEFASLLTSSGIDMVAFLTDIYDSPDEWSHRTKMGGTNKLKGPWLNILGATTPEWIARSLPLDTVGIGLTSRIIFVYSDKPRVKPPFPELSKEQIKLAELLVKDLVTISTISGEFKLTAEAKAHYEAWDLKNQRERSTDDPRLAGYYERRPMHLIKVAMLISAAQRNETLIDVPDLEAALALLEEAEPAMARTFSSVGKNPLTLDIEQVLDALEAAGEAGLPYGVLLDRFKHSVRKDELDEVLQTLQLIGHIRVAQDGTGPKYFVTKLG